VAVAPLLLVVSACSSLPDLHFDEDGSSSGGEGGPDVVGDRPGDSPTDSPKPDACPNKTDEICDDGIDNDCNGHTDCDDSACAPKFQCEPPVPSGGWTPVAFGDTAAASCPTGWATSAAVKFVPGDGTDGSCACSCTGSGGTVATCAAGQYTFQTFGSNACAAAASTTNLNSNSAACIALGTSIDSASGTFATATAPSGPTTCAKNTVITKSNVTDGKACTGPAKFGSGCPGTQVCAPKVDALRYCVMKSGLNACPAPFNVRRRAGSDAVDSRACNDASCNCNVAPCSGTVTAFSNANCMGGTNVAISSATPCSASDFGTNGKIKGYTSNVTGGCSVAAGFDGSVAGNVAFTGDETICCTN